MKLLPVQVGRQGVEGAALHMPCECRLMDHLHPSAKTNQYNSICSVQRRGGWRKMPTKSTKATGEKILQKVNSPLIHFSLLLVF